MSSINKYYTFLTENNISTYESLKEFIQGDLYKLKTKEDKKFNDLAIIYNDKDSNIDNELVRFFNGVIIDKNTLKIVCYTFDKCFEENNLNENLVDTDIIIQPIYEGTLIRLYFYNDKWHISTKKMIDAHKARWVSDKSFGEMFDELFDINSLVEYNKNYCYSFVLGHKDNNILKIENNYIIHINTIDLVNNCEIDSIDNKEYINMNKEELLNYIDTIKNKNNDINVIGYVFMNKNYERQKFITNNYIEIKDLYGNTNNRLFRYLHLRKNTEKMKKYLSLFSNDKQLFVNYENYLMNIATHILNIYRERHISKKILKVPFYIRDIIYNVHGMYLQTKNKVSFQDINVILHNLDEKKFCFIINNIEKDKRKIIEQNETDNMNISQEVDNNI
jgi:hypothetical protein